MLTKKVLKSRLQDHVVGKTIIGVKEGEAFITLELEGGTNLEIPVSDLVNLTDKRGGRRLYSSEEMALRAQVCNTESTSNVGVKFSDLEDTYIFNQIIDSYLVYRGFTRGVLDPVIKAGEDYKLLNIGVPCYSFITEFKGLVLGVYFSEQSVYYEIYTPNRELKEAKHIPTRACAFMTNRCNRENLLGKLLDNIATRLWELE